MKDKKLAFIWDFTVDPIQFYGWKDGLNAALRYLASEYGFHVLPIASDDPNIIFKDIETFDPDYILAWGSLDRPSFAGLQQFGVPVALCHAGGPVYHPNNRLFDVIFVENDTYVRGYRTQGINAIKAFGTNTDLFRHIKSPKKFQYIYPASFAMWKRNELFSQYAKSKGLMVGHCNPDGIEILEKSRKNNTLILPQVTYDVLPHLYNASDITLITAWAGSQRTLLESLACNIPVIVMSDNEECSELVNEIGIGSIADPNIESIKEAEEKISHEYSVDIINEKYSHVNYANIIYENFLS